MYCLAKCHLETLHLVKGLEVNVLYTRQMQRHKLQASLAFNFM